MKISLSETITRMRFPLIVLVVLIHSYDLNRGYCIQGTYFRCNDIIYEKVTYFLTEIVSQIAVPSFFFISGYLFWLLCMWSGNFAFGLLYFKYLC